MIAKIFPIFLIPLAWAQEPDTVFRSDVALVRVDVQVLDRDHRAISGLQPADFILKESGKPQEIRNFQAENMPLDVLMLFDVSVSMKPHVQRIVSAAHSALRVLGKDDRVAIMVFDRNTRTRSPFRQNLDDVERQLDQLVHQEKFNGGTDITRAMYDAASYIGREGRSNARRAIVILTDDETQFDRDDEGVGRALTRADTVLSLLLAPDAMQDRGYGNRGGGGYPQGGQRRRGGMGGGGGMGGIYIPGMPGGGNGGGGQRYPNGGQGGQGGQGGGGSRTKSAGTADIARASGGDDFSIDDGSALETTLNRLRKRYALHFNSGDAEKRFMIDVQLSSAAAARYPDAELRFRRVYLGDGTLKSDPVTINRSSGSSRQADTRPQTSDPDVPVLRRRPAVSGPGGPSGPVIEPEPLRF